jgi:hypothetical protein
MLKSDENSCCGPDRKINNINKEESKLNDAFIKIREEYLEEVKKEKEVQDEEEELKNEEPHLRYAYVTFRSMDAVNIVKRSYRRRGPCLRYCIRKFCDKCCINAL